MTLLITLFAAIISTAWWYSHAPESKMRVDLLCWMFWGASLMWLVDMISEYIEDGIEIFSPEPVEMLYDSYLGLSVVALAGIIWIAYLIIKDPRGVRPRVAQPAYSRPVDADDLVEAR